MLAHSHLHEASGEPLLRREFGVTRALQDSSSGVPGLPRKDIPAAQGHTTREVDETNPERGDRICGT